MRQRTEGDDIHAGLGDLGDIGLGDIAGRLEECSACGDLHRLGHIRAAHIVEHDDLALGIECLLELGQIAHLDLDLGHVTDLLAERIDSRRDAAVNVDVIILEHRALGEIVAVIVAAADGDGVFLEPAQTGEGLAGVGDLGVGALDKLHAVIGRGRDAGEVLEDVQRRADKMDKIGLDGVKAELVEDGYDTASVEKYLGLFDALEDKKDVAVGVDYLLTTLGEHLDEDIANNLKEIALAVNDTKEADFELVFDPTLVRGMSYYTGTIFEIAIPEFGGSCGGGGRYDEMIGKFTGQNVPACGFSIGFERIILLLMEQGYEIPESPKKVAYLVEKKYPADKLAEVMQQAKEARKSGQQVLVVRMNKNKKFQKEQLTNQGYAEFVEFFND